jgi:hypothetical protein
MSRQQSSQTHSFNINPSVKVARSTFDRSHSHKTTFNASDLIPFYVDEALPGDTFNVSASTFSRMATPIYPIMDYLSQSTFFFAVPKRILWDNWAKMNGEQLAPGDSIDYVTPTITSPAGGHPVGSVYDYMGIPTDVPGLVTSALFNRAQNKIWNDWFRDENLQDPVTIHTDDGPDPSTDYTLLKRGKRKDYFNGALPFPQKGDAVELPLGVSAPVKYDTFSGATTATDKFTVTQKSGSGSLGLEYGNTYGSNDGSIPASSFHNLYADLSTATAATINQLREAISVQHILEADARGGTRLPEMILTHFGVQTDDLRLMRSQYLGGGTTPINVSPIAQTSESTGTSPQGQLAAMATASGSGQGFVQSFNEHMIIIGYVSVHADYTYQQGLNRMYSRSTRYDYYLPSLANLGEQAILNKEIYAQGSGNPTEDAAVFGYIPRWDEYRYKPSIITSKFRSTAAGSLDAWHLAQEFTTLPTLSADFITENVPMDRILAVPSEPDFIFDSYFKIKCARPMPIFAVPGLTRF